MRHCSRCNVPLTSVNQSPSGQPHSLQCRNCREYMRRERRREHVRQLYGNNEPCKKCGRLLTPKTAVMSSMETKRFLCKDCDLEYQRRYYRGGVVSEKKASKRKYFHEWYLAHRNDVMTQYQRRKLENEKSHIRRRVMLRQLIFDHYGWECACCGEKREEFLTIDHIKGAGGQHKRAVHHIYEWLVRNNFPADFRTLCLNCNFTIGHRGYCPHQREKLIKPIGHDRMSLMEIFS